MSKTKRDAEILTISQDRDGETVNCSLKYPPTADHIDAVDYYAALVRVMVHCMANSLAMSPVTLAQIVMYGSAGQSDFFNGKGIH